MGRKPGGSRQVGRFTHPRALRMEPSILGVMTGTCTQFAKRQLRVAESEQSGRRTEKRGTLMEKRKLKPKELIRDIRAGTDDATLMHRYALSAQGLQSVFNKLVQAGMVTQAELDDRVPMAERTVDIGLYICPACGNIQAKEFSACPRCGFTPPGYLKRPKEPEPRKEEPAKTTLASKSQVINFKQDKKSPTAPVPHAEPAAREEDAGTAFQGLQKIVSYCRILGIATLVCCFLAVGAMFALTQLGLRAGTLSLGQSLLAATALGMPVVVTALMVFLTLRTLGESIKIFLRISRSRTE